MALLYKSEVEGDPICFKNSNSPADPFLFISDLWLDYVNFEAEHMTAKSAEAIRQRAYSTLKGKELKEKFTLKSEGK